MEDKFQHYGARNGSFVDPLPFTLAVPPNTYLPTMTTRELALTSNIAILHFGQYLQKLTAILTSDEFFITNGNPTSPASKLNMGFTSRQLPKLKRADLSFFYRCGTTEPSTEVHCEDRPFLI